MDFNATIDLIIKDLSEAREIIDDLKNYPGVPVLQVELAKSKCKSAGEVIALLKTLKNNSKEPSQLIQKHDFPEEIFVPEEIPKVNLQEIEKKTELIPEDTILEVEKNLSQEKPLEKVTDTAIIADKFSHLSNRFNEQLGNLKNNDTILMSKPFTSLSEAIGVNDRFLFLREIFNDNKEAYTQAISRLDKAESLHDARAVIMSYTGDNVENEAIKQLLDLVKRKLPSNE
jgi:hypothetical protein